MHDSYVTMLPATEITFENAILWFALAAAIGFFIGRTRKEDENMSTPPGKPGMRDFVMVAIAGAICGLVQDGLFTVAITLSVFGFLCVVRAKSDRRIGMTSEFAAMLTFGLGYLCQTPYRNVAAALGVFVALVLATKDELHSFAIKRISEKEFSDTLKFLALIFIIYPLLPKGAYGPYDFFEPRKVWLFIILVSAVSYVGYFLIKFLDAKKGLLMTALFGGIASTTAYISGTSRAVVSNPEVAADLGKATILADSMLYPRILLVLMAINPTLAEFSMLPLLSMSGVACLLYFGIERFGKKEVKPEKGVGQNNFGFSNPFAFKSALKFGIIFLLVLFITKAGGQIFNKYGTIATSGIGGLINIDAVVLSMSDFVKEEKISKAIALLCILVGTAANAIFKFFLAYMSKNRTFYCRVGLGFIAIISTGFLVYWLQFLAWKATGEN